MKIILEFDTGDDAHALARVLLRFSNRMRVEAAMAETTGERITLEEEDAALSRVITALAAAMREGER